MDTMYQAPFQGSFKDDEAMWSSSSSSFQQPCWSQSEMLVNTSNAFQYPMQQQQIFPHIESQQFLQSFANAFTPGTSPLLGTESSPYLPTLYPVKVEQIASNRPFMTPSSTSSRHIPFPTPGPSPQVSPSPEIKPMVDQPGSINALMKEIQLRSKDMPALSPGSSHCDHDGDDSPPTPVGKSCATGKEKKHICPHSDCGKTFSQKTHLDIHLRSHSGLKPFACPYPPCPSRFTQLGNLKTHIRRHTGEKPFSCDLCPKRFAQRGNVRSHRATVHASREEKRMFECRLDGCGKFFSQRGNLKGHMERFHGDAINELTLKFSGISEADGVSQHLTQEERELWDYLREMYKHSNQGIKGRGKDRKVMAIDPLVASNPTPANTPVSPAPGAFSRPFGHITAVSSTIRRV